MNMTSAGLDDIFLCKLNTLGSLVWAKQMGGPSDDGAETIVTDASGNVYTAGYFSGTADFDPGTSAYDLTSAGDNDIFISKIDGSGNFILARHMGGSDQDGAFSIAIDTALNIYSTGHFSGIADFDPGSGSFNLSAGGHDIFISKLDMFGNFEWAEMIGSSSSNFGNSITVDSSANVYVAGFFTYTADFNSNGTSYMLTSAGSADIFIKKISQNNIISRIKQSNFNNNVVNFFPNPTQGQIQFSFERSIYNGNIKLINTRGQVEMEETNITGNNFTFDISDIPQGIYFLEIRQQAEIIILKLIKNNL